MSPRLARLIRPRPAAPGWGNRDAAGNAGFGLTETDRGQRPSAGSRMQAQADSGSRSATTGIDRSAATVAEAAGAARGDGSARSGAKTAGDRAKRRVRSWSAIATIACFVVLLVLSAIGTAARLLH